MFATPTSTRSFTTSYPSPPNEYTNNHSHSTHTNNAAPAHAFQSISSHYPTPLDYSRSSNPSPDSHTHDDGHTEQIDRQKLLNECQALATPPRQTIQTPTPDNSPPSSTGGPTMTTVHQASGGSSPRTFDPFAPLPSSQPSSSHAYQGSASAPSSASSSTSFAAHNTSPSVSRAPRPSSLYIPLDEKKQAQGTGNTPTWPFNGAAASSGSLAVQQPLDGATPFSPSQIHPSYADAPGATALHQSPPMTSQASQKLYSAIPISSASDGSDAAYSSSSYRQVSRTPSPNMAAKGRGAHISNYSAGTHPLLSARQVSGSPSLANRFDTPTAWLLLYFAFNLGLTLFNKLVLQGFPFPWTLTAIQMLSGTIGTQIALQRGFFTQARLTTKENGIMLMFSGLYTINIAVSNLSLHLVSVPFHQVVRAMTPLFTIIIAVTIFHKRHSRETYLSLIPVVAGVVFATYGDYSFTAWGFILTLIGTLLAAMKTIITNRVQVGRLKLHPLDLLVRMSPLAFTQCVFFGWWSGELDRVREYGATEMTRHKAIALAVNGAIAFGLNVVSFSANKKTSALTMTVAANVKQVLTIVLAVLIFNLSLNRTNVIGIVLTLAGGGWYATVEFHEKRARAAAAALNPRPAPDAEKLG